MARLLLLLVPILLCSAVVLADPPTGRVKGRIDCQATACTGLAALWSTTENTPPAPDRYVLIPLVVSALEADGSFELLAPPGDYFAGAQVRKTPGPLFGAPRAGDLLYMIKQQDDTGYPVTVETDKVIDLGLHSESWTFAGMSKSPKMGVSGQVVDLRQQPVAGLLVFAFADPGATTTPLAVSERTGADGRFVLPLASAGQIYLRVRQNYRGGQPQGEDYVGVSAGGGGQAISVVTGQLTSDVHVQVRKLPSVLEMKNAPDTARPKID